MSILQEHVHSAGQNKRRKKERKEKGGGGGGCRGTGGEWGGGGCRTNYIVAADSVDVNRDQTNGNDLLAAYSRHTVDAGFPSGFHLPGYSVSPIMHLQPQNSSLRTSLDSLYICFLFHKIQLYIARCQNSDCRRNVLWYQEHV